MQISELDSIVEQSLRSFYSEICSLGWCGREREMVSLFALGHLAQHCYPNGPLRLTQMGIEVAVPQLPGERKKKDVCKDLVIWPEDKMTCWNDKFDLCREPMAVLEWKANYVKNSRDHAKNRREHESDIQWLRDTSNRIVACDFVGYAVLIESACSPKELTCVRICRGKDERWIKIPAATLTPV
ncbi:MAG: hypothetical protein LAO24_02315 [Acidobacteriia bacterium]|nr:hypothetical protein [Terriglobia bacterium]